MTTHNHELEFLALQYISDELSDDARAAFEARLVSDQQAREAVAGAVELTLAAREAFDEDALVMAAKREATAPVSRKAWWNVALACGLLAGLVLVTKTMEFGKQPPSPEADLAIAWSEARSEWPASALTTDEITETETLALEDELAVPTWMVAAVSAASQDMPEMGEGDEVPE